MSKSEELHVYGARCLWSGPISKTEVNPVGIPCCPHCGGVLFQIPEYEWKANIASYDNDHPGYADFISWTESLDYCYRSMLDAVTAYENLTGKTAEFFEHA